MIIVERSDTAVFEIRGVDRLDLLHRLTTNNVVTLRPGTGMATVLTNVKGRIVDLLTIYCFDDYLLALGAAGAASAVVAHLNKYTIAEDFVIADITGKVKVFAVIGDSEESMSTMFSPTTGEMSSTPLSHCSATVGSINVVVSRGAFFRGSGWTVIAAGADADQFVKSAEAHGVTVGGSDELTRMRITEGIPISPNELNDKYNPLECGAESAVSFNKGCYLGQEVIARLQSQKKVQRVLVKIIVKDVLAKELPVALFRDEIEIGELTSVVADPSRGGMIGLGVVRKEFVVEGSTLTLPPLRVAQSLRGAEIRSDRDSSG